VSKGEFEKSGLSFFLALVAVLALGAGSLWAVEHFSEHPDVYCDGYWLGAQYAMDMLDGFGFDGEPAECPADHGKTHDDPAVLFCMGGTDGYLATAQPVAGAPHSGWRDAFQASCVEAGAAEDFYAGGGRPPRDS
jgi:hypothetical protein